MKAVVLHGVVPEDAGRDEKDVLVQVDTVSEALTGLGYEPVSIAFSLDIASVIDSIRDVRPEFVFNLVETIAGDGSLIHIAPSIMDFVKIPYTGAKTEAMILTSNKVFAKHFMNAAGIPTPPFLSPLEHSNAPFAGGAYIIKAVWEHASTWLDDDSIIIARDRQSLRQAVLSRQERLGSACFAESFIEGREFNISLLAGDAGPDVLPPAEIRFDDFPQGKARVVDYRSKWVEDSFEYNHTPRCFDFPKEDEPLLRKLTDLARQCWHVFNLRGYARVDFRIDKRGQPWVLEVNANPCLSPDGGFRAAAERSGLNFHRAVERIVQDALKR